MRTLLYSLLICFIPMESPAQILVRDIKKDFGAKGDGRTNDHEAFRRAARFINARKGNVRLLIPAGTYIVGKVLDKPMHLRNNFWYDENFDVPDSIDLFRLKNCTNVSIIGSNGARLKVQDRVKFGSFDPNTGAIPHAGSPPPTLTHPMLMEGFSLIRPPQGYLLIAPPYTVTRNGVTVTRRDTLRNNFSALTGTELFRHQYNRSAYNYQGWYHFTRNGKTDSSYLHFYPEFSYPGNRTTEINPGNLFVFLQCSNISVSNLFINGNSDNYILGGSKNSGSPKGYEIHASVFYLENVMRVRFDNVHETSFGTIGIQVKNVNSVLGNRNQELSFTNCSFTRNGWANFYISGGRGITVSRCRFDSCGFAAKGVIYTAPCSGAGFEDETGEGVQDVVVSNVTAMYNKGAAFNNSYAKDSNFVIRDSRFHSIDYFILIAAKQTHFRNCTFYSSVNFLNSALNDRQKVTFTRCTFTDRLDNGAVTWNDMKFLFCSGHIASPLRLDSCTFVNVNNYFDYIPSSDPGMVEIANCNFEQRHGNMQYGYLYMNGVKMKNNRFSIPQNKRNAGFINEAEQKAPGMIRRVTVKE